jgi:hypothetical protein
VDGGRASGGQGGAQHYGEADGGCHIGLGVAAGAGDLLDSLC